VSGFTIEAAAMPSWAMANFWFEKEKESNDDIFCSICKLIILWRESSGMPDNGSAVMMHNQTHQ
jgi:hypothetical protein